MSADRQSMFSTPAQRDLGFASWLLVGFVLIIFGVIWLLSQTSTIVMPVILAAVLGPSPCRWWTRFSGVECRVPQAPRSSCSVGGDRQVGRLPRRPWHLGQLERCVGAGVDGAGQDRALAEGRGHRHRGHQGGCREGGARDPPDARRRVGRGRQRPDLGHLLPLLRHPRHVLRAQGTLL